VSVATRLPTIPMGCDPGLDSTRAVWCRAGCKRQALFWPSRRRNPPSRSAEARLPLRKPCGAPVGRAVGARRSSYRRVGPQTVSPGPVHWHQTASMRDFSPDGATLPRALRSTVNSGTSRRARAADLVVEPALRSRPSGSARPGLLSRRPHLVQGRVCQKRHLIGTGRVVSLGRGQWARLPPSSGPGLSILALTFAPDGRAWPRHL